MYLRFARLRRFSVRLEASDVGLIDTLYLDPEDWAVRLVALGDHGAAVGQRSVRLVSPMHVARLDERTERLDLALNGTDPYRSASTDRHASMSSEQLDAIDAYYGLPVFWNGTGVWGEYATPAELRDASNGHAPTSSAPELFPHAMLMGRPVFAPDGRLGVISDLLLDLTAWRVRYLIVWVQAPGETGEILLSPFWVNGPPEKPRVTVPMTTEAIVSGPTFAAEELEPLDEQILARYFGFLKE